MLVNTTVSHISPLLTYLPAIAWYEATLQVDSSLLAYPNASYHATNSTGASISFSWWGKGLWVYGAYREALGRYQITLDGNSTEFKGFTGGLDTSAYQLFGAPNLPMGQHHIRMVNIGDDPAQPMFDFDYLIFESEAGNTMVFDHTSDKCVWLPANAEAWAVDAVSHKNQTEALISDIGTGIAVYGVLNAQSSGFGVTVDDVTGFPLSPHAAHNPATNESTLLYMKTDLYQGNHTFWIQNDRPSGSATATQLSISSVVVFSDVEASPTQSNSASANPR
ncbi:uncharacterized protein TRAVEDRAFT_134518 [Trametes versicolor FP-101664 SS1]|uniref:uncharacterized protein n=1 Tax=Trametes versicolor (strain FP-101664) TaxID=717944 RepID=UPI0004622CBB|nr:uncharacterized protein TRAVEDRAFT_134518 [Trametes versicolor FP-101664 SS1]EIW52924.1 hypothetical protein TRAVEDRAFT_134518 [Trametes versicolor FP-101664 SS1]